MKRDLGEEKGNLDKMCIEDIEKRIKGLTDYNDIYKNLLGLGVDKIIQHKANFHGWVA